MIIAPVSHAYMSFFYCVRGDESTHLSQFRIQGVSVIGIAQ